MLAQFVSLLPTLTFLEPTSFAGFGKASLEIHSHSVPVLARITGNLRDAANPFLAVFGRGGGYSRMLVCAVGPYQGIVLLDEMVSTLAIQTEGNWSVELRPLLAARPLSAFSLTRGRGDEVLKPAESRSVAAFIRGNEAAQRFSIIAHQGPMTELLVNTTEPYHQRVTVSEHVEMIEIRAIGPWAMLLV